MDTRNQLNSHTRAHRCFNPILVITTLLGFMQLDTSFGSVSLSRYVRKFPFVAANVSSRRRNINLLPFPEASVRSPVRIG